MPSFPITFAASGSPLLDIVPLTGSEVLVSASGGRVAVVDSTSGRVVRQLRGESGELVPTRIVATLPDRVVLWGWEMVEALDLMNGESLWVIADGDHGIDEEEGTSAGATASPFVVLPHGVGVDASSGRYLEGDVLPSPFDESPRVLLAHPKSGVLIATERRRVVRWDPASSLETLTTLAELPEPTVDLSVAGERIAAVCADGSAWTLSASEQSAPRRAIPPQLGSGEMLFSTIALAPDGLAFALVARFQDTRSYESRLWIAVQGTAIDGSPIEVLLAEPSGRVFGHFLRAIWTSPDTLLVIVEARLMRFRRAGGAWAHEHDLTLPSAASVACACPQGVLVGDAKGALHLFER